MKIHHQKVPNFVNQSLSSSKFFIFSIVFFSLHTLWLALSAHSLPYDEYFHLGFIEFYSHQLSPFIAQQPASVSYLGDITRFPSYLYEYLMSFPYRVFAFFTQDQYIITVLMRSLNIILVIFGLILWRKLLLKIGLSKRLAHLVLFVFMLLPMVVLVAAENNYDNLIFVITPIFLGFALDLLKGSFTIKNIVGFVCLGLINCLVKNQFVVIFAPTTILVVAVILRRYSFKTLMQKLHKSVKSSSCATLILLTLVSVLSAGLFIERIGVNLVRYHSINIDCARVQPFEVCYQNSPWQRNYNTIKDRPTTSSTNLYGNPVSYTQHWITVMMRGFNANFANVPQLAKPWDPYGTYRFKPLLPLLMVASYSVLVATIVCIIVGSKKWWPVRWVRVSLILTLGYMAILWYFNYSSYLQTGQAYAIQPRYLYLLLILLLASCAKIIQLTINNARLASWLAVIVIVIYIYCGGAIGWFLYARSTWYWPNETIINTNQNIQLALQKIIYHQN